METTQRLKPKRVLEFGPGYSTFALIEGGAGSIDAFESSHHWACVWADRLAAYPAVTIRLYEYADPLRIPAIDAFEFDMGLVDGPKDTPKRAAVIEYCATRCKAILVPLEEQDTEPLLRQVCAAISERHGLKMESWHTGPLAGAYALLTGTPSSSL